MFASSGHAAPVRRTYQEVYLENGRWYGTYKKGKYMFPIDEVSVFFHIPYHAATLTFGQDRAGETRCLSQNIPRCT